MKTPGDASRLKAILSASVKLVDKPGIIQQAQEL
jgi:hypothetical protein